MKGMVRPALYGIMAALGIVLIMIGMETKPTFTWPQVALVVGGVFVSLAMTWILKRVIGIAEDA